MKRYIWIRANGTTSLVDIPEEGDAEYRLLWGLVGGPIETVRALAGHLLVVNENGRIKGLKSNPSGSMIGGRSIVGDVVLAGPISGEEFTSVSSAVADAVARDTVISTLIQLHVASTTGGVV